MTELCDICMQYLPCQCPQKDIARALERIAAALEQRNAFFKQSNELASNYNRIFDNGMDKISRSLDRR